MRLLRQLIEKWYKNLPEEHKPKFKNKLKSLEDEVFIPTLYELVTHQYCLEEGWTIEYEPKVVTGKNPDFLVTTKSGYKFILEVATTMDSKDIKTSNKKVQEVTEAISAISTPFKLDLHYLINPNDKVKLKVVAKMVKDWVDKLDTTNTSKRYEMNFGHHSLSLKVQAIIDAPKPTGGCVLSVMDVGGAVPDYSDRIKSVLDDKANKYSSKKTKLPLIVMIADGVGRIRMSETTIDRTLFGRDMITFGDHDNPPMWHKDRSGHFTPSKDENLEWFGKRTGLSAVLYCSLREKSSFQMQVFHNPFPNIPLDEGVFFKMPQLLKWENEKGIIMKWVISNPESSRIYFVL